MRDIALDSTGDLAVDDSGRTRLTTETDGENVAQRLRLRLLLWRGEYELDTAVGVPYTSILGRKNQEARLRLILRRAAETCPGVAEVISLDLTVDSDRNASCSVVVRTVSGEVIPPLNVSLGEFVYAEAA